MICGVGIDIVEVSRMAGIIGKWGGRFVKRVFTSGEIAYCEKYAQPAMHYAVRFAAKESFLKSMGLGLGMGLHLTDIAVATDQRGKPEIRLTGTASAMLSALGKVCVHVSLSHTREAATAMVILEKAEVASG